EEGGKKEGRSDNKGGGIIFMCNAQTKPECFQNLLFGLPMGKKGLVEKIHPGVKLFLYDFDLKLLYGVYRAASKGGINLVRNAFNGKFPAQVKFTTDKDCLPLPESSFKHAIKENYISSRKFNPELDSTQRHFHQYEDRRHSLPVEERRSQVVVHVPPPEDSYRGTHFAPFPLESRHGQFLANAQDDHRYYQQPLTTSEARHITLGSESSHIPLTVGSHHVTSLAESRYLPLAYYHHLAPSSDDSYYRSRANPAHERIAARTPPRDYTAQPGELSVVDRLEELHRTSEISARGARLEDPYRPGEIGARVEGPYRSGEIAGRGARVEDLYRPGEIVTRDARMDYRPGEISARGVRGELYRSDRLVNRAVDLPYPYETSNPAYAQSNQRPVAANGPGVLVSSLYSFVGAPVYR
ncbi:hypothetical protein BRADI_3g57122v3, partial [Brachypodium distachyon]